MFKFDEYLEIKKAYREFNRLKKKTYTAEKKIKPDDEAGRLLWKEANANWGEFIQNNFALLIFDTFKDKKLKLYNRVKDCFVGWDQVFPDNWEKCDEKLRNDLLGLVLEIGYGSYWLPEEYYDDKSRYEGVKWPTCHTKPFKCW